MASEPAASPTHSLEELTRAVFGEVLTVGEVLGRIGPLPTSSTPVVDAQWVGSVGYERHRDSVEFAHALAQAGVERLIDVRELPISRRRGFAKSALAQAMTNAGIEYVHARELGNPKPFRDLYKSGHVDEGRRAYTVLLTQERLGALERLRTLLAEKRCALMCVEDDAAVCHRSVILDALRSHAGLTLDVADLL
jgi:uncharacterized protein (DUF488 family)